MNNTIKVKIESTKNGYSAYSDDVPGCISFGENFEEIKRNMKEAIEAHLELLEYLFF